MKLEKEIHEFMGREGAWDKSATFFLPFSQTVQVQYPLVGMANDKFKTLQDGKMTFSGACPRPFQFLKCGIKRLNFPNCEPKTFLGHLRETQSRTAKYGTLVQYVAQFLYGPSFRTKRTLFDYFRRSFKSSSTEEFQK